MARPRHPEDRVGVYLRTSTRKHLNEYCENLTRLHGRKVSHDAAVRQLLINHVNNIPHMDITEQDTIVHEITIVSCDTCTNN